MNRGPRLMEVDRPDADRSAIACEYRCQWFVDLWVQKHPLDSGFIYNFTHFAIFLLTTSPFMGKIVP